MYKRFFAFSLLSCFLLLAACTAQTGKSSKQQTASTNETSIVRLVDANAEIQSLYSTRCLNCHAIDLSGKMGEVTNLQKVHERLTYDQLVDVISNGRELMPSFNQRLTEDEIKAIASWLAKQ